MIRVYDGQGGDCLDAEEHMMFGHSPIPVRPRCDKRQGIIHVQKPLETQVVADEEENTAKNWFQNAKLTVSGVFVTISLNLLLASWLSLSSSYAFFVGTLVAERNRTTKQIAIAITERSRMLKLMRM